jgi:hypothetical protein
MQGDEDLKSDHHHYHQTPLCQFIMMISDFLFRKYKNYQIALCFKVSLSQTYWFVQITFKNTILWWNTSMPICLFSFPPKDDNSNRWLFNTQLLNLTFISISNSLFHYFSVLWIYVGEKSWVFWKKSIKNQCNIKICWVV